MTKVEQASLMKNARLWHRNRATVTNATLALDLGIARNEDEAIKLCHSLGLYAFGKRYDTKLKTMTDYINKDKL